ncbi:hypothetical protein TNCV_5093671 [Trichonephila clavipes]|nr:hypothetical protein TNCV_5093671 [Trichonephila clavipes]
MAVHSRRCVQMQGPFDVLEELSLQDAGLDLAGKGSRLFGALEKGKFASLASRMRVEEGFSLVPCSRVSVP